jgi:hypothetical protein
MKNILYDTISMGIVGLLIFFYFHQGLEAIIFFIVGLISLRQLRKVILKKTTNKNQLSDSKNT